MKNKIYLFICLFACILLCYGCKNNTEQNKKSNLNVTNNSLKTNAENLNKTDETNEIIAEPKVSVFQSPSFSSAQLKVLPPKAKGNKINLKFEAKNFKLGQITPDYKRKFIPNDKNGQYILVIINNTDFYKTYSNTLEIVNKYDHYNVVAVLCRSYNESLKNKMAKQQFKFNKYAKKFEIVKNAAPKLILNYPNKIESYNFYDAERVIFDPIILNTEIGKFDSKIKIEINDTQNFTFIKLQTYRIDGLQIGNNKIKVQLLDKYNKVVSTINRKFEIIDNR